MGFRERISDTPFMIIIVINIIEFFIEFSRDDGTQRNFLYKDIK